MLLGLPIASLFARAERSITASGTACLDGTKRNDKTKPLSTASDCTVSRPFPPRPSRSLSLSLSLQDNQFSASREKKAQSIEIRHQYIYIRNGDKFNLLHPRILGPVQDGIGHSLLLDPNCTRGIKHRMEAMGSVFISGAAWL